MKKIFFALIVLLFVGCNGQDHYIENPVNLMIKSMSNEKSYTIILDDMDAKDDGHYHKYSVVKVSKSDEITQSKTKFLPVSYEFFKKNENNLGMQIVSKDSTGKVTKAAIPAGYDNYIGNSRYGHWQGSGDQSMWVFYGRYMFLRSVFGLGYHPAYYGMHRGYYGSYYGNSRSFYGAGYQGGNYYGTSSKVTQKNRPDFYQRKARNTNWNSSRRSSSSRRSGRGSGFGYGK